MPERFAPHCRKPVRWAKMAKLSEQHYNRQERFDAQIDECLSFMDDLLGMADRQRSMPGSNQALKKLLPSPYLLHHICPTIMRSENLHAQEAAMLSGVPQVLREAEMRTFVKHPNLSRLSLAGEYLSAMLYGLEVECFHMLCLDKGGRLKENVLLNRGVYDASIFSLRLLLEEIRRVKPDSIILCHNHPGGSFKPSKEDLDCTAETIYAMTSESVPLLDHIIVCSGGIVSLRANGFIAERYWLNQSRGHGLLENFLSEENVPDRARNRVKESYLFCKSSDGESV